MITDIFLVEVNGINLQFDKSFKDYVANVSGKYALLIIMVLFLVLITHLEINHASMSFLSKKVSSFSAKQFNNLCILWQLVMFDLLCVSSCTMQVQGCVSAIS